MTVMATYSEIYDLSTTIGKTALMKFHTPQDGAPVRHLGGYFAQHRRFMYGGMDIMLIPVATLPFDPAGISLAPGDTLADPRDIVNPILHRHYHGEKLPGALVETQRISGNAGGLAALVNLPSGQSVDGIELQNNASTPYSGSLMDPSFKKSHVQRGFRASAKPYVYPMTANHQIASLMTSATSASWDHQGVPDITMGTRSTSTAASTANAIPHTTVDSLQPTDRYPIYERGHASYTAPANRGLFSTGQEMFTSGLRPMGWMDTEPFLSRTPSTVSGADVIDGTAMPRLRIPLVYTYVTMLPPAFKQKLYFRLIIRHKLAFKEFRTTAGLTGTNLTLYTGTGIPDGGVSPSAVEAENVEWVEKVAEGAEGSV